MTMIERLKADQLAARKAKDTATTTLLSTLIGEAVKVGKDSGNRDSTDQEVIAVVKKFKKNVEDTKALLSAQTRAMVYTEQDRALDDEIAIYDRYIPQQISDEDLHNTIKLFKDKNPNIQMKDVMAYLKENFAGLYDGKVASQLANKILKN